MFSYLKRVIEDFKALKRQERRTSLGIGRVYEKIPDSSPDNPVKLKGKLLLSMQIIRKDGGVEHKQVETDVLIAPRAKEEIE